MSIAVVKAGCGHLVTIHRSTNGMGRTLAEQRPPRRCDACEQRLAETPCGECGEPLGRRRSFWRLRDGVMTHFCDECGSRLFESETSAAQA